MFVATELVPFSAAEGVRINDDELLYGCETLKSWLDLLTLKRDATLESRLVIYLKALCQIPWSYKLWHLFFNEVEIWLSEGYMPRSATLNTIEQLFERAVSYLPKIPSLRVRHAKFLYKYQKKVTATRHAYDAALKALPVTQHNLIWPAYMEFVHEVQSPVMAIPIFKRFVMYNPHFREVFAIYLAKSQRYDQAAIVLASICSDVHFKSLSHPLVLKQDLWVELCTLLALHSKEIPSLDTPKLIKSAISKFPDSTAMLWACLATAHATNSNFDLAIHTYQQALQQTYTVDDFLQLYDAYALFLETSIQTLADLQTDRGEARANELKFRMNLLSKLVNNRAEMLSSAKIRRNPHDVTEWLHRAKLFLTPPDKRNSITYDLSNIVPLDLDSKSVPDPVKVIETFTEALQTIDPLKSTKPSVALLWIHLARFYEIFDDNHNARLVLQRACESPHKNLESIVSVWLVILVEKINKSHRCERVEFELRHKEYSEALVLARQAVSVQRVEVDGPRSRLHLSVRLWSLCADLEENFGTFESFRAAYNRMFDLKTITVQQVLIFAELLEKKKYFEDAFQVYERGLHAFRWPHCLDIWLVYLSKFVSRYAGRKVDRTRELFEQAVADVPESCAFKLFFMYAKFEENYGLIRNALTIYHRAAPRVLESERLQVYQILIGTTAEYFGITKTRPIFAEAMENVPDSEVLTLGLRCAEMETSLMEFDRARAIFEHTSQYADPSQEKDFWNQWRTFEVNHGDEETFREMLRKKRAYAAQFDEAKSLYFDQDLLDELKQRTGKT